MATLRDIRNRIDGVAKTQKITRAMKMVATAKFSRATNAINAARPYAKKLREVLGSVSSGADADAHPLLAVRPSVRKLDLLVITSDRGLCGAYNANIIKRAERELVSRHPSLDSISIFCVGRKATDYFRRRKQYGEMVKSWQGISTVTPAHAREIAGVLSERYEQGLTDEVKLVYSEFVSALSQKPTTEVLLPLRVESTEAPLVYEVEPDAESLLALLVPRAVEFAVFRAMLENQAGEHGARMTAMESATSNTQELIKSLTLVANKVRQSKITAELVEIVSGAESL